MTRYSKVIMASLLFSVLCSHYLVSAQEMSGPKMVLKEVVFDFKGVDEGQAIEHTFQVFNKGDQPLRINKVTPG